KAPGSFTCAPGARASRTATHGTSTMPGLSARWCGERLAEAGARPGLVAAGPGCGRRHAAATGCWVAERSEDRARGVDRYLREALGLPGDEGQSAGADKRTERGARRS